MSNIEKTTVNTASRSVSSTKRRRNREIAIALLLVIIIFLATWGQTSYFGSDSWYFLVLLNLNGILMVLFFYLTVRNIARLISERRRKVFGSRLRTRLLLAFGGLSLVPILLMYLAANRVIITSIDYWFTNTVSSTVDAALDLGQDIYFASSKRVADRIIYINEEISDDIINKKIRNPDAYTPLVQKHFKEYQPLLSTSLLVFVDYKEQKPNILLSMPELSNIQVFLQNALNVIPWESIDSTEPYLTLITIGTSDFAFSALPLRDNPTKYIVVAELLGNVAQTNLKSISQGFDEYSHLKSLRRPLRLSFSLILGLLGLIMIFSAIFMAFRFSKELTSPIEALTKGTDRIAHGELDVLLEDRGEDELGQLVASFNSMAIEVRSSNQEIQRTNLELESRNLFIENLLENITTGVCVFSLDGKFISINKAASSIFELDENIWLNDNPLDYLQSHERKLFAEVFEFLAKNPSKRWRQEEELKRKHSSIKLFITALILPQFTGIIDENSEKVENVIILIEDITELSRVERLGAWREVAKRIAHEMKNPLTPIRLSAERLERKFSSQNTDPAFNECTQLILTESARMQEMISNFTNFAKMPEVLPKEENILTLLAESINIFKASHSHIKWSIDTEKMPKEQGAYTLLLHAETFKQAMMNIYLNASEALEHTENPEVITSLATNEDYCILTIADNGTTLEDEVIKHIFEPYYSRKNSGTGLGLAIVQSILADHKAIVHAENNKFGGFSIIIEFPKIV